MRKLIALICCAACLFLYTACEKIKWVEGTPSPIISIEDVRYLYKGQDLTLNEDNLLGAHQIVGIVVSDQLGGNTPEGTIVLQNYRRKQIRGITLAIGQDAATYAIGDSLVVNVTGTVLKKVDGSLQLSGVTKGSIQLISQNNSVTPAVVTIGQLIDKPQTYESTLVRVYSGSVTPTPVSGELYSGDKTFTTGTDVITLHTQPTAGFAHNKLPASATFTGIPFVATNATKGDEIKLWPRNISDMLDASGPVYPGYPEDFETPDAAVKGLYAAGSVDLRTGSWLMDQVKLGNAASDRKNPDGKQSVRIQGNLTTSAYLQMNYDLPNGASKVTVMYGSYNTDGPSTFRLEYSTDKGKTWKQIGNDVSDPTPAIKTATFLMDISGPVRFRINKRGLGTTNNTTIFNGQSSMDDFAVYAN